MAQNTNSLFNRYSRYVAGGSTETANGRIEWWERNIMATDVTDIEYAVEKFYEGRLDLISSVFYDEPRWWWLIAQYNNMTDPISETTEGRIIYIPSKDRLQLMLMTVTGGSPSTKQSINTISPIIS
jgi:hypothetical protein